MLRDVRPGGSARTDEHTAPESSGGNRSKAQSILKERHIGQNQPVMRYHN
jgi:hypothetical protein